MAAQREPGQVLEVKSARRPSLANPGEVWLWEGNRREFYILFEDHRVKNGQMYVGLNTRTGAAEPCFMSYDRFNGWQRLA